MIPRGSRCLIALSVTVGTAILGCNPYDRRSGEFFAGSVDPAHFPAAYLGQGGKGSMPGMGLFVPSLGSVNNRTVFYYAFPLPDTQAMADNPLDPSPLGTTGSGPDLAYVFDAQPPNPFPTSPRCQEPPGYQYNPQQDAYRLDEQGNIFTALPDAMGYVPLVSEVAVVSVGEPCQDIKSEDTLLTRMDARVPQIPATPGVPGAKPHGKPSGRYLAWAIIDPASRVLGPSDDPMNPPLSGLGLQHWGWYNHYLLAYLDGGYLPTNQDPMTGKTALLTQELYYPTKIVKTDPKTMKPTSADGHLGSGHDILQAKRGDAAYSPLCHVSSYVPKQDNNMLPIDVTDEKSIDPKTVMEDPTTPYVYCLQVQ